MVATTSIPIAIPQLPTTLNTRHHPQLLEPVQTDLPIRAGVPVASETLARLKTAQHVTALARIESAATSVSRVSAARMGRLETGRLEVETLRASGFACWMGGWDGGRAERRVWSGGLFFGLGNRHGRVCKASTNIERPGLRPLGLDKPRKEANFIEHQRPRKMPNTTPSVPRIMGDPPWR